MRIQFAIDSYDYEIDPKHLGSLAELVAKHLTLPRGASSDENASYVSVVAADKGQGMSIVGTWQSVYQ